MQLLKNPKSTAANLTSLELRFCNLGDEVIAQLLYHAPPNIKRLVLLCRKSEVNYDLQEGTAGETAPHLCPLLRRYGKRLIHLEFGSGRICRELFFDEDEIESLQRDGIMTRLGSVIGSLADGVHIDANALEATIQRCRQKKKNLMREDRIQKALIEGQGKCMEARSHGSLFSSTTKTPLDEAKTRRNMEALFDEEEEQRARVIKDSKSGWFRRFIAWEGLCFPGDSFEELQIAANMEEDGINWVLASL